jgi:PAS domain-containing protein
MNGGASSTEQRSGAKSLPLILARELAANLATPMFLIDAGGMLVFYNDAAAALIGKPFGELGEIPASEFGAVLELATPDGKPLRRRDSPAGVALFTQRPAHTTLVATSYNGIRRAYEATAYPLFGATGEMHGVVSVFWEDRPVPPVVLPEGTS